jgi:hypothetical protein
MLESTIVGKGKSSEGRQLVINDTKQKKDFLWVEGGR